jgi:hypothetical protein
LSFGRPGIAIETIDPVISANPDAPAPIAPDKYLASGNKRRAGKLVDMHNPIAHDSKAGYTIECSVRPEIAIGISGNFVNGTAQFVGDFDSMVVRAVKSD